MDIEAFSNLFFALQHYYDLFMEWDADWLAVGFLPVWKLTCMPHNIIGDSTNAFNMLSLKPVHFPHSKQPVTGICPNQRAHRQT
jgi:hypothetical protein